MKTIVIGGGAAGFFGAIVCAEASPDSDVLILEKGRDVLSKVRISGGGRCNVTHACFDPAALVRNYPRGHRELRGPFSRFQPTDTAEWFRRHGVALKTEPDGRMFPTSNQSQTIIDCLTQAANDSGVTVRTQASVQSISKTTDGFSLGMSDGETLYADRLLLATGSNREGYRFSESLGHAIVAPVPSLFTFEIQSPLLEGLAGLSVQSASVSLEGSSLEQMGPVLITHWGLSGPAVLKLSAWGARVLHDATYQKTVRVNWLPRLTSEQSKELLNGMRNTGARQQINLKSPFPEFAKRLWERFVQVSGIPWMRVWGELSKEEVLQLTAVLHKTTLAITGKGTFKEEFVTCGGVSLKEVNFKTMESRRTPGLHFAGEILDIDGVTGGFNFQNAWTTGYLAGTAMALTK